MNKFHLFLVFAITAFGCSSLHRETGSGGWELSVLPSSVRLDPVKNEIIDNRFSLAAVNNEQGQEMLKKNIIYDGARVRLFAARGEYISCQLVVTNNSGKTLKNIRVAMPAFSSAGSRLPAGPEFFLEWAVQVKTPSTGYSKASLGPGWYPDALIPFRYIQDDSAAVRSRWTYPLWLPDFNNRIDNQRSMIVWIDQYVPFDRESAMPGTYSSEISVTIDGQTRKIPVGLTVWDFALPNSNKFKASLQHEGFLRNMSEKQELELYQLFKRNRIALLDPTYDPDLQISGGGKISIDWKSFDERLDKYFSGKAFTKEYGYMYGPGYGEPIETFVLPFDVYGKHGTKGWPDTGKPDAEREPANKALYTDCIKKVREHFKSLIDPRKTDITVYLNGLDESYFPEAWSRMVYYGDLFREYYPEALFRIDGGYTEEALQIVKNSITSWASHTIEYDFDKIKKYQDMGIKVWLYGPMLYESKVNSWVGSSTFIDLPLVNDRAISWSCWKYRTFSWISWGAGAGWVNGWYDPESWKDASRAGPESESEYTYKKLNGNALLVYSPGVVPGIDGPCPSVRLKTMRDGVQEYEYMRLLSELDNNKSRADSVVNTIIKQPFGPKAIGNLDVWSYNAEKWDENRIILGKMINESISGR
jgi:Glycoside hydrolase 123, catalytic domain